MSIVKVHRKHLDTHKWDQLIQSSYTGTVQAETWYIDLLTEGNWWACCLVQDTTEEWQAVMPLYESKKMGNVFSRQPLLSKYWGVLVKRLPDDSGEYQRASHVKKCMQELLKVNLERTAVLDYFTGISPIYPLEYQWQNVSLGSRFTYVLPLQPEMTALRSQYSKSVRKRIRKLSDAGFTNRFHTNSTHLEQVLMANVAEGRSLVPQNAVEPLKKLSEKALELEKGFFLSTFSPSGELAAAGFWVHNQEYVHFISGYVMPAFRKENVMSLMVDRAIDHSRSLSKSFDFFGSSIESIETFFRSFGARPLPYYRIIKAKFPFSLIWKM